MALKSDITLDASLFAASSIPAETNAFNDKLIQIMSTGPKWYEVPLLLIPLLLIPLLLIPLYSICSGLPVSYSVFTGWRTKVSQNARRRRDTTARRHLPRICRRF